MSISFKFFMLCCCFFLFLLLMSEIRDFFIKTLDDSATGIKGMMAHLSSLLQEKDFVVRQRLRDQELYPQYYSFRRITLLQSQEFPLPDVVRIWNFLFSDSERYDYLICLIYLIGLKSVAPWLRYCTTNSCKATLWMWSCCRIFLPWMWIWFFPKPVACSRQY